jgi:hypothetical protein
VSGWLYYRNILRCTDLRKSNEELLHRLIKERNIVLTVNRRKGNWIGYILCGNCLLQQVIEGNIKGGIGVTRRRGRIGKQLLV